MIDKLDSALNMYGICIEFLRIATEFNSTKMHVFCHTFFLALAMKFSSKLSHILSKCPQNDLKMPRNMDAFMVPFDAILKNLDQAGPYCSLFFYKGHNESDVWYVRYKTKIDNWYA